MRKFFDKLMKAFGKSTTKESKRNLQLEPLEERQLLSVSSFGDSLCDVAGTKLAVIDNGDNTATVSRAVYIDLTGVTGTGSTSGNYYLTVTPDKYDFNASNIKIENTDTKDQIGFQFKNNVSGLTDVILVQLANGGKYKVTFSDSANSDATILETKDAGSISVSLGLIGDQLNKENSNGIDKANNSTVDQDELDYIDAAIEADIMKTMIGKNGSAYTTQDEFKDTYGLDYSMVAANLDKFDFNFDGKVTNDDYNLAKNNEGIEGTWKMTDDDQGPGFQGVENLGTPVNNTYYVDSSTNTQSEPDSTYFGNSEAVSNTNAFAVFEDISSLNQAAVEVKDADGETLFTVDFLDSANAAFLIQSDPDSDGFYTYRFDLSVFDRWANADPGNDITRIVSATFTLTDDADNQTVQEINFSVTKDAVTPPVVEKIPDKPEDPLVPTESGTANPQEGEPNFSKNLSDLTDNTDPTNPVHLIANDDGTPYSGDLVYALATDTSVYKAKKDLDIDGTTYKAGDELPYTVIDKLAFGEDYITLYTSGSQTIYVSADGAISKSVTENAKAINYRYTLDSDGNIDFYIDSDASFLSDPNAAEWKTALLPADFYVTDVYNYAKYPTDFAKWTAGSVDIKIDGVNDAPTAVDDTSLTMDATANASLSFDLLDNDTDPDASDTQTIIKIEGNSISTTQALYATLGSAAVDGSYSLSFITDTVDENTEKCIKLLLNANGDLQITLLNGNPFNFLKFNDFVILKSSYTMQDIGDSTDDANFEIKFTNKENIKPTADSVIIDNLVENGTNQKVTLTASDTNIGDNKNTGDILSASLIENSVEITAKLGDVSYTASYKVSTDSRYEVTDGTNTWYYDNGWKDSGNVEVVDTKLISFFNGLKGIVESQNTIFTFAANEFVAGKYEYDVANGKTSPEFTLEFNDGTLFEFLGEGETATVTLKWKVNDGAADSDNATITATITGKNDAPTLTAEEQTLTLTNLISESGSVINISNLNISDPDINDTFKFAAGTYTGTKYLTSEGLVDAQPTSGHFNTVVFSKTDSDLTIKVTDYDSKDSYLKWDLNGLEESNFNFNIQISDSQSALSDAVIPFAVTGQNDDPVIAAGQIINISTDVTLDENKNSVSINAVSIQLDKDASIGSSTVTVSSSFKFVYNGTTYSSESNDLSGDLLEIKNAIADALADNLGTVTLNSENKIVFGDKTAEGDNDFITALKGIYNNNANLQSILLSATVEVTDSNTLTDSESLTINVVEKLPPQVSSESTLAGNVNENSELSVNLDKAVDPDNGLFTVEKAEEDESSFNRPDETGHDWYDFKNLTVSGVVTTYSETTPEKVYSDTDIKSSLDAIIGSDITCENNGEFKIDLSKSGVFDYLGADDFAVITFSVEVYDNDYNVMTPVTFTVTVNGEVDPIHSASMSDNINDCLDNSTSYDQTDTDKKTTLASDLSFAFKDLFALTDATGNADRYDLALTLAADKYTGTGYQFTIDELDIIKGLLVIGEDNNISAVADTTAITAITDILKKLKKDSSVELTWTVTATNNSDYGEQVTSTIVLTVYGTNQEPTATGKFTDNDKVQFGWTFKTDDTSSILTEVSITEGTTSSYTTAPETFGISDIDVGDVFTIKLVPNVSSVDELDITPSQTTDETRYLTIISKINDMIAEAGGLEDFFESFSMTGTDDAGNTVDTISINDKDFSFLRTGESISFEVGYYAYNNEPVGTVLPNGTFKFTISGVDTLPVVDTNIGELTAGLEDVTTGAQQIKNGIENVDTNAGFTNPQNQIFIIETQIISDLAISSKTNQTDNNIMPSEVLSFLDINESDLKNLSIDLTNGLIYTQRADLSGKLLKLNSDQNLTFKINYTVKYEGIESLETKSVTVTVTGTNQNPVVSGENSDDATEGWSVIKNENVISKISVAENVKTNYVISDKTLGVSDVDYNDTTSIHLEPKVTYDTGTIIGLTITIDPALTGEAANARINAINTDIINLIGIELSDDPAAVQLKIKTFLSSIITTDDNLNQIITLTGQDFSFLRLNESISFEVEYYATDAMLSTSATPNKSFFFEITGIATMPDVPAITGEAYDTESGNWEAMPKSLDNGLDANDVEGNILTYDFTPSVMVPTFRYDDGTGLAEKTESEVLALINNNSVKWSDVLKPNTEKTAFEYNGTALKWLAANAKLEITYSIIATSANGIVSPAGKYTLTVTGTDTDLDLETIPAQTVVVRSATDSIHTDYIKVGTFNVSTDHGRAYTFSVAGQSTTGTKTEATDDSAQIVSDTFLCDYSNGTVTVYIKQNAVWNGTDNTDSDFLVGYTYPIVVSYTEEATDPDSGSKTMNLTISDKSLPDITGSATAISGNEGDESKPAATITVSDKDDMAIPEGWTLAVANVSNFAGTTAFLPETSDIEVIEVIKAAFKASVMTSATDNKSASGTIELDLTNDVFNPLEAGMTLIFDVTYTVTDGKYGLSSIGTITVTITGTNDAPIATTTHLTTNVHALTPLNVSDRANDVDGTIDTTKLNVYNENTAIELDSANTTATLSDGTKVTFAADGTFTIDYTGTELYSKTSGIENKKIKLGVFDNSGAETVTEYDVDVTGDYVAPSFVTIADQIGSVGGTSTKFIDVDTVNGYNKTITINLLDKITAADDIKANLEFEISFTGKDGSTVTLNKNVSTASNLNDIFKSVSYDVLNKSLVIEYMDQNAYTGKEDFSDVAITVKATDTKTSNEISTTFKAELAEKNVVEIAIVAANNNLLSYTTTTQYKNSGLVCSYISSASFDSLSTAAANSTINLSTNSGEKVYLNMWFRDNSDQYFGLSAREQKDFVNNSESTNLIGEYTLQSLQFLIKVDPDTINAASYETTYEKIVDGDSFTIDNVGKIISDNSGVNKYTRISAEPLEAGYLWFTLGVNTNYTDYISETHNHGFDGTGLYLGSISMTLKTDVTNFSFAMEPIDISSEELNTYFNVGNVNGYKYTRCIDDDSSIRQIGDINNDSQFYIDRYYPTSASLNGIGQSETIINGGIYLRTVNDATETDNAGKIEKLGTNIDYVSEWDMYYTEIWVKADRAISSVSVDLTYDHSLFNAADVEFGSAFSNGNYSINSGSVSGISAEFTNTASGDGYYLLARVKMEAVKNGGINFADANSPRSLGMELSNGLLTLQNGATASAYLGKASTTEAWAVAYDADDDGLISMMDYVAFAQNFGKSSVGNLLVSLFDFDSDGVVTTQDYVAFAQRFGVSQSQVTSGQDKMCYPASFNQRYIGSTLKTQEDSAWIGVVLDAAEKAWQEKLNLSDSETISVQLYVKDLGNEQLAESRFITDKEGKTIGAIYLDNDAMGNTWYAGLDSDVSGSTKYDLYTVMLHELGHIYGYEHVDTDSDLMYETLTPGTRKTLDDCSALKISESEDLLVIDTVASDIESDPDDQNGFNIYDACLILESQPVLVASNKVIAEMKAAGIAIDNIQPVLTPSEIAGVLANEAEDDEDDQFEIVGSASVTNNDLALSLLLDEDDEKNDDLI